ncbi:MAG: nucleotide exchange factor GrpE [Candidatus Tectomicrobia bacterium]|nr:nucleotide exchange factor GrpE [Candidatus Tectomicrobia bacterium]
MQEHDTIENLELDERDRLIQTVQKQLEEKSKEAESYLDRLSRLQAEFENYKKRVIKEREEYFALATAELILKFLPILDNLERAMAALGTSSHPDALGEGIKIILQQFKATLTNIGVEEIQSIGENFDPLKHDAMMIVESPDHDDQTIIEELEKGYYFKERVLRPAKVVVAKKRSEEISRPLSEQGQFNQERVDP